MPLKIALIGNPNSGKTTLFNILTGANQTVGNWPGVTVEKKQGRLVCDRSVFICDLPGVYSLSPYTAEESIVKEYLENEPPDLIVNIIDASNLERNLYLTTQILELNIPTVLALNMMDIVKKQNIKIDIARLENILDCKVIEISASHNKGIDRLIDTVISCGDLHKKNLPKLRFDDNTEKSLAKISDITGLDNCRHTIISLFERDENTFKILKIDKAFRINIEKVISKAEHMFGDKSENIIAEQRYLQIDKICRQCKKSAKIRKTSISNKIDDIVTNKYFAFPIFIIVMTLIYSLSMGSFSRNASEFISDGIFGDGWHLFGIGAPEYSKALEEYNVADTIITEFEKDGMPHSKIIYVNKGNNALQKLAVTYDDYENALKVQIPDPQNFGIWVPGLQTLIPSVLSRIKCSQTIISLICDGILAGVGSVLGFIPQMLILFLCLSMLESCGYMSRIAFITDKILSRFGLSGKSFIPIIMGTGCGVPGVMAARTIESHSDKIITITTTTFMPCSAKLPLIALITSSFFNNAMWVAPFVYIISILSIFISGIILKKIKRFSGESSPFIMEMPPYRWPKISVIYKSVKERILSFIKKAGTVIVLASIGVWILSNYGLSGAQIIKCEIKDSLLAELGRLSAPVFVPLGWNSWELSVSTLSGIIAKENIVSSLSILLDKSNVNTIMSDLISCNAALSFLIFNVLCAPCLAAISAIFREMHSTKRTVFAIIYQCVFAYAAAFFTYHTSVFVLPLLIVILFAAVHLTQKNKKYLA